MKVIEFDKESKKIVLSALAWLKEQDENVIEEYISSHKLEKVTVQDIKAAETTTVDAADFPAFDTPEDTPAPFTPSASNGESKE